MGFFVFVTKLTQLICKWCPRSYTSRTVSQTLPGRYSVACREIRSDCRADHSPPPSYPFEVTSNTTETTNALPPKRAALAREYLRDLNGARAARDAGYAAKSASVEASRLLGNPDVQAEIKRQRAILAEQTDVTPEKIVAELAAIAFADLGDYIRIIKGVPILHLSELPAGATRAIYSVDVDELSNGTKRTRIKLHDKHAALVSLAKMFGLLTGDSPGVAIVINEAEKIELKTITTEQLRAGIAALTEGAPVVEVAPERINVESAGDESESVERSDVEASVQRGAPRGGTPGASGAGPP